MNKYILSKLIIIILLLTIVINNISYAVNVTKNDLKESIYKIFGSNIEIQTIFKVKVEPGEGVTVEGGDMTSTSTVTYDAPDEISITDSQIILKEIEEGQEMLIKINYAFENNKCVFDMNSSLEDFGLEESSPEETAFMLIAILMMQSESIANGFMAAADSLGIDLNLAHSYYSQIVSYAQDGEKDAEGKYNQTIESDVFKYTVFYDGNTINVQSKIEIDMEKLSKVNETYLNGDAKSTVKLTNTPNLDNGNENENIENNAVNNTTNNNIANNTINNNVVTNATNNNVNNTTNNVVNNTISEKNEIPKNIVNNSSTENVDSTISNKEIPAAGTKTEKLYYICVGMITVSLLIYINLNKYNNVK